MEKRLIITLTDRDTGEILGSVGMKMCRQNVCNIQFNLDPSHPRSGESVCFTWLNTFFRGIYKGKHLNLELQVLEPEYPNCPLDIF